MSLHLTPELLRAYRRRQISQAELLDLVFDHLAEVCPHCREGFAVLEAEPVPVNPILHLASWSTLLARFGPELAEAEERAHRDVAQLRRLPPQDRRGRIERAYRRFRGVAFIDFMLEESRRHLHSDPRETYHWAELAWVAAYESPNLPADSVALARAEMANALRAAGDLAAADRIFEHVRYLVEHGPVEDLRVLARAHHFEGCLRKDQRRFEEAHKRLGWAIFLYRMAGRGADEARARLTQASAWFHQGQVDKAIDSVRTVLDQPENHQDSELCGWALHNLACYLAEADRLAEVGVVRSESQLVGGPWSPVDQIRRDWLDARILAVRGEQEKAAEALDCVMNSFLDREMIYAAAMVARDLALVYGWLGRQREAEALAEEVARTIVSSGADSRAIASLKPYLGRLSERPPSISS